MAYIDYEQAFPLCSQDYMLEIIKEYKIWTHMILEWPNSCVLRIAFFRVTHSALQFFLALNPLIKRLNNRSDGCHVGKDTKLQSILYITLQFSTGNSIKLGLDKCRKLHLVRGEIDIQLGNNNQAFIRAMTERDFYFGFRISQMVSKIIFFASRGKLDDYSPVSGGKTADFPPVVRLVSNRIDTNQIKNVNNNHNHTFRSFPIDLSNWIFMQFYCICTSGKTVDSALHELTRSVPRGAYTTHAAAWT